MGFKGIALTLAGTVLGSTCLYAGTMGPELPSMHAVAAILGGYANITGGDSQTYFYVEQGNFVYENAEAGKDGGFIGGFLGVEFPLAFHGFSVQTGLEYDYFSRVQVDGQNYVGADPLTFTVYNFTYQYQTQQLLGVAKLLGTMYDKYHPYAAVGLGGAFNKASNFTAVTQETDPINIAPLFANYSSSAFSYTLGLGVDVDVYDHVRLGLGYRYSSFGTVKLGQGATIFGAYSSPTPFTLVTSNAFANQFLAQLSYIA